MSKPNPRAAADVVTTEEMAANEAALAAEATAQAATGLTFESAPANGSGAVRLPAEGLRIAALGAAKPLEDTAEPFKRFDGHPFSREAEKELEKVLSTIRAYLVKRAVRAKNDMRGDIVSAYNVRTAAADPMQRSQPLATKLVGMGGNVVLGAAFGALVSLLVAPPPDGLKPSMIATLVVLVTLGTIGAVWQVMRD